MSGAIFSSKGKLFCISSKVVVNVRTCIGCRPAARPVGTVVEVNGKGFLRVQFNDGTRRWFSSEELSPC